MSVLPDTGSGRPGFPTAVVGAALATGAGAVPVFAGVSGDRMPAAAVESVGWVALGLAGALLLDRPGTRRVGVVLAAGAVVPAVVGGAAGFRAPDRPWDEFDLLWDRVGWGVVLALVVAVLATAGRAVDRESRRRVVWLVVWAAVLGGFVVAGRLTADPDRAAVVTAAGLCVFTAAVPRVLVARELRPVAEPLADAALVAGAVAVSVALGQGVRAVGSWSGLPATDASAAFVTVAAAALSWPLGIWLRRTFLARRYGHGALTPADVTVITAGLHPEADPRELLATAAGMVAAASGHQDVRIVLGADEPDGDDALHHPLVVAGGRVGTLSIVRGHRDGPEPRQVRVVTQLLPTVSLVARAVGLAIEADHARADVAHQRDLERSRILGDLHDGVGPVLAGLGMRVQAELRRAPTPLLEVLATELADCRGDLRRIVSGLTPSALEDGDLAVALGRLVDSFAGEGRPVRLRTGLPAALPTEVAVAVYRCVAEGISNALRHGDPSQVGVYVRSGPDGVVRVEVCDDGTGGTVVPGVGLTSLRRRAEQLGGHLQVGPVHPTGVRLHVELPVPVVVP